LTSFASRCLRLAARLGPLRRAADTLRYPGLRVARGVNLQVAGQFSYGAGCGIGEGSNILVPSQALLLLGSECYIGRHVELGPGGRIEIGADTSLQDRCILLGEVKVGRYCRFAPNVFISSGQHYFDLQPTWLIRDQDEQAGRDPRLSAAHNARVTVEDDCWIGINTVVMRGTTVGKGAIVGAGSIVTADVAPYTVVAGTPAKVIRRRLEFDPPRRLHHANQQHWPYFYSGFEMSQAALREFSALGGIAVLGEFELSLDTSAPGALHLVARTTDGSQGELLVEGQRRGVGSEFSQLVFDGGAVPRRIRGQVRGPGVVVQEAWIA
jgi:acetyltransferase-like isoleucine patch superfamily enzyme